MYTVHALYLAWCTAGLSPKHCIQCSGTCLLLVNAVQPGSINCGLAVQVANMDFFTKMIPLFDAGDDIGMILSPQCFHNVNVGADIFNHCNINFWEYAQHGYDAFGFNSCTGTNFLTRSVAFEQAGWSPEYTLTEDYALGMELTKRKWHCRYVEEYLAIGEAPEQVRNCFQQRSRWCKVSSPGSKSKRLKESIYRRLFNNLMHAC